MSAYEEWGFDRRFFYITLNYMNLLYTVYSRKQLRYFREDLVVVSCTLYHCTHIVNGTFLCKSKPLNSGSGRCLTLKM